MMNGQGVSLTSAQPCPVAGTLAIGSLVSGKTNVWLTEPFLERVRRAFQLSPESPKQTSFEPPLKRRDNSNENAKSPLKA